MKQLVVIFTSLCALMPVGAQEVLTLEECLEFIDDDELLEITPKSLRMRKAILNHEQRMKSLKGKK